MAKFLSIFCLFNGYTTSQGFDVLIESGASVSRLAQRVMEMSNIAFDPLNVPTLWKVNLSDAEKGSAVTVEVKTIANKTELHPKERLSTLTLDDDTYVIIQLREKVAVRPAPVVPSESPMFVDDSPAASRPHVECWQQLVENINITFFAYESEGSESLARFMEPGIGIPTTTGALAGLPNIQARAKQGLNKPNLMFLNLPVSVEAEEPPSTTDRALEKIYGRVIPLLPFFGVTGCGKTRTAIEMLCKNWGFYFNASDTDLGSDDLSVFLKLVQETARYQNRDLESNNHVHTLTLALVLTRILVLNRCLDIAENKGVPFTCKKWMLLQVDARSVGVQDLFANLFLSIAAAIHCYTVGTVEMSALVRGRFTSLRQRLLEAPSLRFGDKVLLVIDEAQNLGKEGYGAFLSQRRPSEAARQAGGSALDDYMQPILSPLMHGFYKTSAYRDTFCVMPCATGFSIFDLKWLEDSGAITKGYQEQLGPFTNFQGWRSLEQVQEYRHLIRRSLLNDDSRDNFDDLVPGESVEELYERLRGRFRPIVSAIELMLTPSSDQSDWRMAIKKIEDRLSSTAQPLYGRGNIAFDINRMVERVARDEARYAEYHNIQTTLKAFVLEHHLPEYPLILDGEEAPLVEASVGRILHFGEEPKTVLDEPFALLAARNYFQMLTWMMNQ
ncbi:hypothetical protein EMPS_10587 [Entomortierella parvispora]|uniref:Uncharacterized protein n=1 Tax=Entomortierella parvispora TaxID=205924 RepID=A0A9P3HKU6_9FUNG|nr:hypothetical protein EMPS_10587 [Entomortierella parvispora]